MDNMHMTSFEYIGRPCLDVKRKLFVWLVLYAVRTNNNVFFSSLFHHRLTSEMADVYDVNAWSTNLYYI